MALDTQSANQSVRIPYGPSSSGSVAESYPALPRYYSCYYVALLYFEDDTYFFYELVRGWHAHPIELQLQSAARPHGEERDRATIQLGLHETMLPRRSQFDPHDVRDLNVLSVFVVFFFFDVGEPKSVVPKISQTVGKECVVRM